MTYTDIFKASKFIAVHFLIAFTMEILIVQIFILDFYSIERSQSFLTSLATIYEDVIQLILKIQTNDLIFKEITQYSLDLISRAKRKKKRGHRKPPGHSLS